MLMTKIKTLKNWNEDHTKRVPFVPRTHVNAVFDDNGNTLDSLMAVQDEKLSELGSKVEELGSVSDIDAFIDKESVYVTKDGERVTSASWLTYKYSAKNVKKVYKAVGHSNSTDFTFIGFYDKNDAFLGGVTFGGLSNEKITITDIDVPFNCEYITLSNRIATSSDFYLSVVFFNGLQYVFERLNNKVTEVEKIANKNSQEINSIKIAANKNDGEKGSYYYDSLSNTLSTSASWESYLYANIGLDKVRVMGAVGNNTNFNVISYFSSYPSAESYIGGVQFVRTEFLADYESDIPRECKYVLVSNRTANNPVGDIALFCSSFRNINKSIAKQIDSVNNNIDNALSVTRVLSDYNIIWPGYYATIKTTGVVFAESGSWYSWLIPVNGGEIINAVLGRADVFQSNIVFLDSESINSENVIGYHQNFTDVGEVTYTNVVVPDNCKAVLLCNRTQNCEMPSLSMTEKADLHKIIENEKTLKILQESKSFINRGAFGNYIVGETKQRMQTLRVGSDSTFIGDYRLTFFAFDAEPEVELRIQKFDNGYTEAPTVDKVCYHKFNHCNTVDYNEITDCLIFGNGGAIYADDAEFYVIPNARELFVNAEEGHIFTFENTPHITYNCVPYNMGQKMQALWGERNGMNGNIVYLITNDNEDIYKVLLGIGSNQFDKGVYNFNGDNAFNGTFKLLNEYHQKLPIKIVNQGSQFHKGKILCGAGGNNIHLMAFTLKEDGTIETDNFEQFTYNSDGSLLNRPTNSLCVDKDGKIIIGCLLLYEGSSNRAIVFNDYNW